ncbi:MAG: acyl-CoA thioesterase [Woeseiaceae bacterium]|nr:acyl-CoA thioesterase [Woeseiaceae bacterium]
MNLYFRLLRAYLNGLMGGRLKHSDAAESRFRVWLHDLDAFGHMNNGRYLQIMDVARTEWMTRVGVFAAMRRHKWSALLGGGVVRYRYSLRMLQVYRVRTRLLHWDRRWFYLEHAFIDKSGRCVAAGVTRAGIRGNGNWVPAVQVVAAVGADADPPPVAPPYLRTWLKLEDELFAAAEAHASHACQAPNAGSLH